MIVFVGKVLECGLSGQGVPQYSGPEFYEPLAQGERFFVQIRASQVTTGSGTTTLTAELESSNDGVSWEGRGAITLTPSTLSNNAVNNLFGSDTVTTKVPGAKLRIKITQTVSVNPNAYIEVWITARAD